MAHWLCIGRTEDQDFTAAIVNDTTNHQLPFGAKALLDEKMNARLDLVIEIGENDRPLVTDGETEIGVVFIDL